MITVYEYEVRGTGHFPFDMLRYDCCWPANSNAATLLSSRLDYSRKRTFQMKSHNPPTEGRWNSFGWEITTIKKNGREVKVLT